MTVTTQRTARELSPVFSSPSLVVAACSTIAWQEFGAQICGGNLRVESLDPSGQEFWDTLTPSGVRSANLEAARSKAACNEVQKRR